MDEKSIRQELDTLFATLAICQAENKMILQLLAIAARKAGVAREDFVGKIPVLRDKYLQEQIILLDKSYPDISGRISEYLDAARKDLGLPDLSQQD